jgi:hypothetical protein
LKQRRLGIGKRGGQISRQDRLLPFDVPNAFASQAGDDRQKRSVGMKRIGSADPPGQRQAGHKSLGHRDLMGRFGHGHREECVVTGMGPKREQVGSRLFVRSGAPHGLAIQSHGIIRAGDQRAAGPVRQGAFDLLGMQARQAFAGPRTRRAQEATRPNEPFAHQVLVTTPWGNGQGRVGMTTQTRDHAGEHIGQFRASSMPGARIGKR